MNKNVIALPYWAKEILETLKCYKLNTFIIMGKTIYFGTNPLHNFAVSEGVNNEGKPIYLVSYSRRDCFKPNDKDKTAITNRLTPLLGEPINSSEGENCDYLAFNRKVN